MDSNYTKQVRISSWINMVKAQNESGLSIDKWCEINNIRSNTFYYRRKLLRDMIGDSCSEEISNLLGHPTEVQKQQFVEMHQLMKIKSQSDPPEEKYDFFKPVAIMKVGTVRIEMSNGITAELVREIGEMIKNAL